MKGIGKLHAVASAEPLSLSGPLTLSACSKTVESPHKYYVWEGLALSSREEILAKFNSLVMCSSCLSKAVSELANGVRYLEVIGEKKKGSEVEAA